MSANQRQFEAVYEVVRLIPPGMVMSYGQVGALANVNARVVGWAMANVEGTDVPWQRVVGTDGYLRIGRRSPEMAALQRSLLTEEGIKFSSENTVDIDKHRLET